MTQFVSQSWISKTGDQLEPNLAFGFVLPFLLLIIQQTGTLCNQHFFHKGFTLGSRIRIALISIIYRKSLRLSTKARTEFSTGKIMNIASVDASRVEQLIPYLHCLWTNPVQILLALALLITFIGTASFTGFGILLLFIPLQMLTAKYLVHFRKNAQEITDRRLRLTQEMLQGLRAIKYFATESVFVLRLQKLRSLELVYTCSYMYVKSILGAVATSLPTLATIATLLVYSANGNTLNPIAVFTALALFNSVAVPLSTLPIVIDFCDEFRLTFL